MAVVRALQERDKVAIYTERGSSPTLVRGTLISYTETEVLVRRDNKIVHYDVRGSVIQMGRIRNA